MRAVVITLLTTSFLTSLSACAPQTLLDRPGHWP